MSAVVKKPDILIRPMSERDITFIIDIENCAYEFPWNKTIFVSRNRFLAKWLRQ